MTHSIKMVLAALAVGACAAGGGSGGPSPVTTPLYSEFRQADGGESTYGPFLAATLAQQGDEHARAAHYYLEALKADPDSQFVADRAFFQLLFAGRMDEAAALSNKLLTSADLGPDDLIRLTNVLEAFKRKDWPEVRVRIDRHKGTSFSFLVAPILKAWSFAAEGNEQGAREALAPLLDDERLRPIGEEQLAYILDNLNRFDEAKKVYLDLADSDHPTSLQVLVAYAYMLYREGDKEGARQFLGDKTKQYADNRFLLREGMRIVAGETPTQQSATPSGAASAVFHRLGSEFAQGRSTQAAIIYLRLASYLAPDVAEIYYMLGNLLMQSENAPEAVTAYASVPRMSPLRAMADIRRVEALRAAGRTNEAEDNIRNMLRDRPQDILLLTTLADMLREREAFAEAAARYSQAIDLTRVPEPSDWFKYFARGICYERTGEWEKAERDMLMALRLNPGEASVLNYLGYSWIDRGTNIEEAKKLIEKAAEASPDDGFIIDSFGWVHYLTGDYDRAVDLLEKAVRLVPDDATINDHLGDAYWRVGRKIEARFQWRHALASDPAQGLSRTLRQKLEDGLPDIS
ncbi:MAG: tetratricopeptide repeat protein [Alphaproteobacteria bacterium]|nr:MAG: tetratricopeptide repeat protein [Alphaproteobacteria bacterium]